MRGQRAVAPGTNVGGEGLLHRWQEQAGTTDMPNNNALAVPSGQTDDSVGVSVTLYAPTVGMVPKAPNSIGSTGSSLPFATTSPFLTVDVCIALQENFASRS